jgi:hypothetical protein
MKITDKNNKILMKVIHKKKKKKKKELVREGKKKIKVLMRVILFLLKVPCCTMLVANAQSFTSSSLPFMCACCLPCITLPQIYLVFSNNLFQDHQTLDERSIYIEYILGPPRRNSRHKHHMEGSTLSFGQ